MPFALLPTGLETQTQAEVQAEILARLQAEFGATLNTSLKSVSGQFARIIGELLASYQQQALALYQSIDPNSAAGVQLNQRAALTGSVRRGETRSTVEGVLTATGACVVPDGTTVRNDTYQTTWEVIGGPYNFAGAGSQAATIRAVEAGPLQSFAGDPWTITSPIANLSSFATADEDATVGRLIESDPAFRARRTGELFAAGQGPLVAISGAVLRIPGVSWCRAFHNPDESPVGTDPDRNVGIPYKRFEVVCMFDEGPPSSALVTQICETIWGQQGAGVTSYGVDYSDTIIDSEGNGQKVAFSEVTDVSTQLEITITTSDDDEPIIPISPSEMGALIRSSCVARSALLSVPGRDFRALDYVGEVTRLITAGELSGIDAATALVSEDGDPITQQKVTITIRQRNVLAGGQITVIIDGTSY